MTKLTKRDHFNALLSIPAVAENETLVAFIENELELLNRKRASVNGKPSKNQEENQCIKEKILEVLADGKMMTISEMQKADDVLGNFSNQKLNALVKQLKDDEHKLEKVTDKRKAYFKLA